MTWHLIKISSLTPDSLQPSTRHSLMPTRTPARTPRATRTPTSTVTPTRTPSATPTPEACSALPQCKPDPKLSAADKPKPPTVSVTGSSKVTISLSPAILGYPTDPSRQSALNTKLKELAGKKPINLTKLLRPFYVIKVTPGGLRPSEAAPMAIVKSVNYEGKAPKVTVQLAPGSYRVTGAVSVKTAAGKPFAVGQVSAPIVITVK